MKIKKLVISNYKVFDYLELDFTDRKGHILNTIVFAGLNGSGKTTILELLKDLIEGNVPNQLKIDTLIRLEILVEKYYIDGNKNVSQKSFSTVDKDGNRKIDTLKEYSDKYDILVFDYRKEDDESHFSAFSQIIKYIYPVSHHLLYFYSYVKPKKNDSSVKNIAEYTFTAHNQQIQQAILNIISSKVFANPDTAPRQIFTKHVSDLNKIFHNLDLASKLIEVSEKDLIFESANGQKVRFDDLSSGEKMLYFMGFTLNHLNPKDTCIMVDQPEDSLHPKWQQQIVQFFQNIGTGNQVILATHSPQIIASVHPESLFVLAINEQTHHVDAINMEDEHKHSYGVDPNRILSEIMGTPLRDYKTQQHINVLTETIKRIELDPSVLELSDLEKQIDLLAEDLGKQDAAIMRFKNELRLLKRKIEVVR